MYRGFESGGSGSAPGIDKTLVGESRGNFFREKENFALGAVFANNFCQHLYGIAGQILEQEGLDFSLLRPLIFETAHKVMLMTPENAQTGPARRGDESILGMHKAMLKDNRKLLNLYTQLSDSIRASVLKSAEQKAESDNKPLMLTLW